MKKIAVLFLLIQGLFTMGYSQNTSEEFKPGGKPLALIFANFHSDFVDGETYPGYEITRAYLGYEYSFSKEWYAKTVLDVGDPGTGNLQMTAYLKNAYMQYSKNNFTASFGLVATTQFKVSEKIWGNRYLEKSFQDAYKFNASADLGMSFDYRFADFISADFTLVNGEGYKKLQSDKYLRPGLGVTINPVKEVTARVYADYMGEKINQLSQAEQQSLATFLAYTGSKFTIAGEYNYQKNFGMTEGKDIYGTSIFANYYPCKNLKLIGRFDDLRSKKLTGATDPWNFSKDGQLFIAGLEYSPVKGVKITPNFRFWNTADNSAPNTTSLYLNCELKF